MQKNKIKFVFFGTPEFSVIVLDELKSADFIPSLVVTAEDKPKGRKLVLTPPEVKVWAEKNGVPCLQPKTLKDPSVAEHIEQIQAEFFVVASYGKIIPQNILDMPKRGALNVHPSLLPKLRGASPIESAILSENETGVTIIKLDEQMDHGPILARHKIETSEWPPYFEMLEKDLARAGGKLLAGILPDWLSHKLNEQHQDHGKATLCGKIKKEDGLLDLTQDPELNLRKIRAYHIWPTAYFFKDGKRIIVKRAHIDDGELVIDRIVPEGKKEMDYKKLK